MRYDNACQRKPSQQEKDNIFLSKHCTKRSFGQKLTLMVMRRRLCRAGALV